MKKLLAILHVGLLLSLASAVQLTSEQQKFFLEALGLSSVPKPDRGLIEIPDSIRELYAQQSGQEVDTTNFRVPGHHVGASNTARTFVSRQVAGCGSASSACILGFDVNSEAYTTETLQSAVLKVYWKPKLSVQRTQGSFRASVSEVLKLKKPIITMLVDTKKLFHRDASKDEGWYTFDVTPAVKRWIEEGKKPKQQLLAVEKGKMAVKSKKGLLQHFLPEGAFSDAYMVAYSEDSRHRSERLKRSTMKRSKKRTRKKKGHRSNCKRHSLYVDFSEVGWNDWIVAPPGYDAHFCAGDCFFPFAEHMNATNHAVVQTMVNSVNSAIPRACCVPTELSPISMLYLDEYEKVVLKNYENMKVEGCGCR